jgi:DNA-binding transcriptional LysR family regulator
LDIKYLEAVLAVARYLSFSRAAEELFCSQSSISRQISTIENKLGYTLFERSTKSGSVRLTDQGAMLIPQINKVVNEYDRLFGSHDKHKKVSFILGMLSGPFNLMAKSRIITYTYLRYPEIELSLQDVNRRLYLNMLIQGKIDGMLMYLAFIKGEEPDNLSFEHGDLSYTFLKTQYPSIVFPRSHPLAGRESVSFKELKDEVFLLNYDITKTGIRKEDVMHEGLLRSCQRYGFMPKIATMNAMGCNIPNVRDTIIVKNGWIYPTFQSNALRSGDDVTFVPVSDPIYYANYYFITLKNKSGNTASKIRDCLAKLLEQ